MVKTIINDEGRFALIPVFKLNELSDEVKSKVILENVQVCTDLELNFDEDGLFDKYTDLLEIQGLRDVSSCFRFLKSIAGGVNEFVAIVAICEYLDVSHFTIGYVLDLIGEKYFTENIEANEYLFTEDGNVVGGIE